MALFHGCKVESRFFTEIEGALVVAFITLRSDLSDRLYKRMYDLFPFRVAANCCPYAIWTELEFLRGLLNGFYHFLGTFYLG